MVVERKGHNDKVFKVSLAETVESIKQHIETLLGINVSQQTLFFNGKRLEDSHIIESIRGTAFNPRLEDSHEMEAGRELNRFASIWAKARVMGSNCYLLTYNLCER